VVVVPGAITILVNNINQTQSIQNIILVQDHKLLVNDIWEFENIGNVFIIQNHALFVQDILQTERIDSVIIIQQCFLTIQSLYEFQFIDSIIVRIADLKFLKIANSVIKEDLRMIPDKQADLVISVLIPFLIRSILRKDLKMTDKILENLKLKSRMQ
jgi:hypothetical protein